MPDSNHHNRAVDASPVNPGQEMSGFCPFCSSPVGVTSGPKTLCFRHELPYCGAWERVCCIGGFTPAERDAFDAFIVGFEPGASSIQRPSDT